MNSKFLRIKFLKMSKYTKELLLEILNSKNATLLGEYPKLINLTKISFKCSCSEEEIKSFLSLTQNEHAYCKKCTLKIRSENTEKNNLQKKLEYLDKTAKENNISIIGSYETIDKDTKIKFLCKCGIESEKIFNSIQANDLILCKTCVVDHKSKQFKETTMKNHGVEHPSKLESIKEKKKKRVKRILELNILVK
jgi:hypothetical protein